MGNSPYQQSVRFGAPRLGCCPMGCVVWGQRGAGLSILALTSHQAPWCQDAARSSPCPHPTSVGVSHVMCSEITAVQAHALGVAAGCLCRWCLALPVQYGPQQPLAVSLYLTKALNPFFDIRSRWQREEALCHQSTEPGQNVAAEAGGVLDCCSSFALPLQVWKMWLSSWTWRLSFISLISSWPSR